MASHGVVLGSNPLGLETMGHYGPINWEEASTNPTGAMEVAVPQTAYGHRDLTSPSYEWGCHRANL